jgi:predicted nucleotidyltransferase component of viral defense system
MKTFPPKKSAIERVSGLLVTVDEAFIEKDWYVVQVLRLLNDMQTHNFQIAFGGGTSLAKAGIIKRMFRI